MEVMAAHDSMIKNTPESLVLACDNLAVFAERFSCDQATADRVFSGQAAEMPEFIRLKPGEVPAN
jgi:hypothetical protein